MFLRSIGAAISDDQELEIRIGLGEHGTDGEAQYIGPVMRRQ